MFDRHAGKLLAAVVIRSGRSLRQHRRVLTSIVAARSSATDYSGLLGEALNHVAKQFIHPTAKASHALQHDLNLE